MQKEELLDILHNGDIWMVRLWLYGTESNTASLKEHLHERNAHEALTFGKS